MRTKLERLLVVVFVMLAVVSGIATEACVEEMLGVQYVGAPLLRGLLSIDAPLLAAIENATLVLVFVSVLVCVFLASAFMLVDMFSSRRER